MKKIVSLLIVISFLLSLVSVTFAEGNEILFADSFENGMKGWKYHNADAFTNTKITDTCSTGGKNSVYIYDPGKDFATGVDTEYLSVKEGDVVSVSVDSYIIEGTVRVFLKFFDGSKNQLFNKSSGSKASGKWENVVITETAPTGTKYCQLIICSISATPGKAYFDNAKVVKGTLEPYEITGGTIPQKEEDLSGDIEIVIPQKPEAELLYTESFENGMDEWTHHNSKLADCVMITEQKAFDGKKSVFLTDQTDTTAPGIKSKFFEIEAGETYSTAAHLFGIQNKSIKLWLKFFDKDKKSVFSSSAATTVDDVWGEISCTGTAPSNAVYCQFLVAGVSSTIGDVYADNVRLYKGIYEAKKVQSTKYNPPVQANPVDSKIIAPKDNKLVYNTYTEKGDKLSDFSYAGFYGGDYELPLSENLPIKETLSPTGKDDTASIQGAIDRAERKDGGINIVKLKAGTYNISAKGITVKSGVLLSGEGQGPTGTILYAYSPIDHTVIKVSGKTPSDVGDKAYILDEYVPSGSKTMNVSLEDAKKFKVGDTIAIYHNSTNEWAKAIKMYGVINVYDNDTTWGPNKVNMITERTITKINGTELTFDYAVFVPYMKELVPSYITKIDDSEKVQNAGIENLRIVSYYNGSSTDENHARTAISITDAKNIFIRDVTGKHFIFAVVTSGKRARQVTVRNCSSLEPISLIAGARRYSFASSTSAQQILYTGCLSHAGRHDFETSYSVTGPISYVDNVVDAGNTGSETHGTWSTGVLFDNVYHIGHDTKGTLALANHGKNGTQLSQGWTAAGSVMWNCLSSAIVVHKPPLNYQNFSVGIWGHYKDEAAYKVKENYINSNKRLYRNGESIEHTEANFATDENTPFVGDGYREADYTPVNPRSLYKAQLSERYTGVISNARPNAPVIVFPKMDSETDDNKVTVSGIYQLGAEKVTVYIDNVVYNASLNSETNEFEFTTTLSEGVHKIYATQTINGIEGNKNADRFITIGKANGNPEYLQSIYSPDKLRMIINDPRPTYDQIINGIKVKINNNLLYSDVLPYETQGRVLVPMRAIFEKLNASVLWDEKTATATASKDGIEVKITENSTKAYVNGNEVILDVPATIINGRFVVPVRFISESFGAKVGWIDETKTVTIEN